MKVLARLVGVRVTFVKYCEMIVESIKNDMEPNRLLALAIDSAGRKELNSFGWHSGQSSAEGYVRFQLGLVARKPGVLSQESPMKWVRASGKAFLVGL